MYQNVTMFLKAAQKKNLNDFKKKTISERFSFKKLSHSNLYYKELYFKFKT